MSWKDEMTFEGLENRLKSVPEKPLEETFDYKGHEEEAKPCQCTNTNAAPDTEPRYSKTSTPQENEPAPSQDASAEPSEPSKPEAPSDSSEQAGRQPTEVKPLGDPTADDTPEDRQGKFRALVDRFMWGKPNPLLAKGKYRELGTFTIWRNGHIDVGKAVMKDKSARPFKVIAVQVDRRGTTFMATAQPILKRKPDWWNDAIFGDVIRDFLAEMKEIFQSLNERQFKTKGIATVNSPTEMVLEKN